MKNRFIRKFLVICAAMLFVCAVSVWAAAEETTPATPTDLTPAETADSEENLSDSGIYNDSVIWYSLCHTNV